MVHTRSGVLGVDVRRGGDRHDAVGRPPGPSQSAGRCRRIDRRPLDQRDNGLFSHRCGHWRHQFRLAWRQGGAGPRHGRLHVDVLVVYRRLLLRRDPLATWNVHLPRLIGHGRGMVIGGGPGHGGVARASPVQAGRPHWGRGQLWVPLHCFGRAHVAGYRKRLAMDDARWGQSRRTGTTGPVLRAGIRTLEGSGEKGWP